MDTPGITFRPRTGNMKSDALSGTQGISLLDAMNNNTNAIPLAPVSSNVPAPRSSGRLTATPLHMARNTVIDVNEIAKIPPPTPSMTARTNRYYEDKKKYGNKLPNGKALLKSDYMYYNPKDIPDKSEPRSPYAPKTILYNGEFVLVHPIYKEGDEYDMIDLGIYGNPRYMMRLKNTICQPPKFERNVSALNFTECFPEAFRFKDYDSLKRHEQEIIRREEQLNPKPKRKIVEEVNRLVEREMRSSRPVIDRDDIFNESDSGATIPWELIPVTTPATTPRYNLITPRIPATPRLSAPAPITPITPLRLHIITK